MISSDSLDQEKMQARAAKVRAAIAARFQAGQKNAALRTDMHRRGVFMPEKYTFVGWYWLSEWKKADGETASAMRVSETLEKFFESEEALDFRAVAYGDFGKCAVCGARFMMGEVWQHSETLDMVHIGHDCVAKYRMAGANWDAIEDERRRYLDGRKSAEALKVKRAEMYAANPDLEAAFAVNHHIIRDIAGKFERYGSISEKQIALVLKIAREESARSEKRAQQATEAHVDAPEGRLTVRGVVVSKKTYYGPYGASVKMTVKVTSPAGSWLCWGSVPAVISDVRTGETVTFEAQLERGRDAHFALFKRPTQARVIRDIAA